MLALIKNRIEVIQQVKEGGMVIIPSIVSTSPAVDGWEYTHIIYDGPEYIEVETEDGNPALIPNESRQEIGRDVYSLKTIVGEINPEDGYRATNIRVEIIEGKPTYLFDSVLIPPPNIISRRQFYQGLAHHNIISREEAKDAVLKGIIPNAIQEIVDAITNEDSKFDTIMLLMGANEIYFDHPLVHVIALIRGMTDEELNTFWWDCATIV